MKKFEIIHTASFEVVKNDVSQIGEVKITRIVLAESAAQALDKCPFVEDTHIEAAAKKSYDFVFAGEVTTQYVAEN